MTTIPHIGFTGTRNRPTAASMATLDRLLGEAHTAGAEFHHGDCVGSDAAAGRLARAIGYQLVIHPPTNPTHRAYSHLPGDVLIAEDGYWLRNQAIVEATGRLIAISGHFVAQPINTSGTWYTIGFARSLGRPVTVIWPDGTTDPAGADA